MHFKNPFGIIIFFLLNACRFSDTSINIENLYIKDLYEKKEILKYEIMSRVAKQKKYKGYDLDFYTDVQQRILDYFIMTENTLFNNAKTRTDIFIRYKKYGLLINNYLDSVRTHCKKYFLKDDLNSMRIDYIDSVSVFQVNSDSLFKLLLLSDLTTQLNEISYLSTGYGCKLNVYIENGNFYDFFITQTYIGKNYSCKVMIKNNFINQNIDPDKLDISLKSLNKISGNDTIKMNTNIQFVRNKNKYVSNDFLLNKGKYVMTLEVRFYFYDDGLKVGEINYDFEIK